MQLYCGHTFLTACFPLDFSLSGQMHIGFYLTLPLALQIKQSDAGGQAVDKQQHPPLTGVVLVFKKHKLLHLAPLHV